VVEVRAERASTPPRLVASDLDGTLVRSDGTVSPYTAEVLAAVEAAGAVVVFVTGRPLRWAEEVFEHVGQHGLAVVANGALVWDVGRHDVHLLRPIDAELGLEACRLLRAALPDTAFAVETLHGITVEEGFRDQRRVPEDARRTPVSGLFDEPVVKLLALHEELAPQEFWDLAEEALGGRLVITWSSSSALLEISAPGVTKASTLALLCADLGVEPTTWWRSATCPTTCRCSPGPARRTRWPTPTPPSPRPPTTSRRATTRTAWRGSWLVCSTCDLLRWRACP